MDVWLVRAKMPKALSRWFLILYIFIWFVATLATDWFENMTLLEILFVVHFVFIVFAGLILIAYLLTPTEDLR
ncbi:MAG: hypothetical protein H0Z18_06790 [Thermococcus sp.]|uniref:hypothetical protein n=1 Tax=Thermococcus sp. TaxID=35749 RepID=UPI001D331AEF|nr:hypothetical protein [Thermococcus sp.]MBO8174947.1 hypothetical protein [Thermococcus sp.]